MQAFGAAAPFKVQAKKGACLDPKIAEQIEEQAPAVCSFTDCQAVAKELLRYLGFEVAERDGELIVLKNLTVRSVEFRNAPKVLKSSLETAKLLIEGKPYNPQTVKSVEQLLLFRLRSAGYPSPKLKVELQKARCGYRLLFLFETGALLVVKRLKVEAPDFVKEKAYRLFSRVVGRSVDASTLRELEEELVGWLVNRGYFNAKVSVSYSVLSKGGKEWPVELKVVVVPGKPYRVVFVGNRHFKSSQLEKLTTFKKDRSFDEFELEASRRNLERFYKDHGFPYAKVKASVVEKSGFVEVLFKIEEGPFVVVKRVEGLNLKEYPQLSELLNRPFSLKRVEKVKEELLFKLKERGYLKARLSWSLKGDALLFSLKRGPKFVLSRVEMPKSFGCSLPFKPGIPYRPDLKAQLIDSLSSCLADRGHPDASVKVKESFKREGGRVLVTLKVQLSPGPLYRFGYVVVKGLKRTKLSALKNLLTVKPASVYSRSAEVKEYSRLSDSRLFSFITINDVKSDHAVSQAIEVKEGALLSGRGFVGYGTDSGFVLNGFYSSSSPLGWGVKYFLFGNYRQKEGYDAVFKLVKPAFPLKHYDLSYSIVKKGQIFQSFKSDKTLYSFALHRKASKVFSQDFKFEVSREKVKDTQIQTKRFFLERRLSYLQNYDRRDNVANPKRGYLLRSKLTLAGLLLGGNTDYLLFDAKGLYLFTPFRPITFAFRAGFGAIEALKGSTVPVPDRFFLGGAESVRGYKYGTISPTDSKGNYVGGRAYGLLSVELRYNFKNNLQLALFYDSGKVFSTPKEFSLSDWYSSVGVGLRYITPVGPLRVDYGYKLKKVPGQGSGRIHISFGFPF